MLNRPFIQTKFSIQEMQFIQSIPEKDWMDTTEWENFVFGKNAIKWPGVQCIQINHDRGEVIFRKDEVVVAIPEEAMQGYYRALATFDAHVYLLGD